MNKTIQMVCIGGQWVATQAKKKSKALSVGVTTFVGSAGFAQAADRTVEIGAAATEGMANVTAVIAGVIGIAILGFGVGKMLGWFTR